MVCENLGIYFNIPMSSNLKSDIFYGIGRILLWKTQASLIKWTHVWLFS